VELGDEMEEFSKTTVNDLGGDGDKMFSDIGFLVIIWKLVDEKAR